MRIKNTLQKILLTSMLIPASLVAFAPTNFFPPYDPALTLPQADKCDPFRLGINVEYGQTRHGRNGDAHRVNILQIYDDTQAVIPMFLEAQNTDATDQFLCLGQPLDNGTRGHVKFTGKFSMVDATPHVRYIFPWDIGDLALGVYLPIRHAQVTDIHFVDQTQGNTEQDLAIKAFIADLENNVKALGGPDLGSWHKTDIGDLVIMFDWLMNFCQNRDGLKNVALHAKLGVSCPTSDERDEDEAFSFALGNDGAWGMPFGLGIDLDFRCTLRLGGEAEFLVLFDHSKTRRIKTEVHQTEFLLLNKARATKDYGLTWKFYLYLQAFHFWKGLSLKAAYEYVKHDDDRLTLRSDTFSTSVANSAESLDEWNHHNMIFSLNYDFFDECWAVKPQFSLFYKLPITGKRVVNPQTFGGQFAINF